MFNLSIRNYQIIRKADLVFTPGLNVILGQSNNGKSSIIRSLETALFNIPRANHITLGETYSQVIMQYNGNEIIWQRDSKSSSQVTYTVNGELYQKLSKGQPEFITELFGISEEVIDDNKLRLNFQKQMTFPFMLDKTPAQLFKFIIQSSEKDNLLDVLDDMKKDYKDMKENEKILTGKKDEVYSILLSTGTELENLSKYKPHCNEVFELESTINFYNRLGSMKENITKVSDNLNNLILAKGKLSKLKKNTDSLFKQYEQNIQDYSNIKSVVQNINSCIDKMSEFKSSKDKLELIISNLTNFIDRVQGFISLIEKSSVELKSIDNVLKSLKEKESKLKALKVDKKHKTDEFNSVSDKISRYEEIRDKGKKIEIEFNSLRSLFKQIRLFSIKLEELKDSSDTLNKEIQDINSELSEFKVCPYCNSSLENNHKH